MNEKTDLAAFHRRIAQRFAIMILYYKCVLDGGVTEFLKRIFREDAFNERHKDDPTWPKGPAAFEKIARGLNGNLGGGLDNLDTKILDIYAEDNKVIVWTYQTGIRNSNSTDIPALTGLQFGDTFRELQRHAFSFDEDNMIYLHEVEFWVVKEKCHVLMDSQVQIML